MTVYSKRWRERNLFFLLSIVNLKLACGKVESLTGMPASLIVPAHQVGPVGGVASQGEDLECPSNQT